MGQQSLKSPGSKKRRFIDGSGWGFLCRDLAPQSAPSFSRHLGKISRTASRSQLSGRLRLYHARPMRRIAIPANCPRRSIEGRHRFPPEIRAAHWNRRRRVGNRGPALGSPPWLEVCTTHRWRRQSRANPSLKARSPDGADSGPIIGGSGRQKGCLGRKLAVNRTVSVGWPVPLTDPELQQFRLFFGIAALVAG